MMITHPHILLKVAAAPNPKIARAWRDLAISELPSGIPAEADVMVDGASKSSAFYVKKAVDSTCYVIPLARDLSMAEAQKVAIAWDSAWPDDDFEIDYSTPGSAAELMKEVQHTGLREIAMEAARTNHTDWVAGMADKGWGYGPTYDIKHKKNPLMLPWERLSPRYQSEQLKRFDDLIGVLERMDLHLVRRRQ